MIHNTRLPLADYDRVFPYDPKDAPESVHLESRGLLWNESFSEGLSPIAFFIHAIAGRQTIVEGATKTGGSGYSMRLGVKLMESCTTEYDGTVRDDGRIIQFQYNGTGLDPKPGRGRCRRGHFDREGGWGGGAGGPPPAGSSRREPGIAGRSPT
jgi:hypothetical protein